MERWINKVNKAKKFISVLTLISVLMISIVPCVGFASEAKDVVDAGATAAQTSNVGESEEQIASESADNNEDGDTGSTEPVEPEVKNGLIDENGNTYYYVNDVKQSGWQTVDGNTYYFDPKSKAMYKGKKTIDKKTYYFDAKGVRKTGLITISGSKYYFNPNMQTGPQKINSKLYYFDSKGKATTKKGWFKGSDNKYRYGLGSGVIASGARKVGGTLYWFNMRTGTKYGKGYFTYKGASYYCKGDGKLATKWTVLNNKAYYFYPSSGKQAKNTTIGYLKIPKCGYLGSAYAYGIKALNKSGWTLTAAYKNSYKLKYANRWMRKSSSEAYALYGWKYKKGNCYVMAATFYVQAKLLGYNVRQIEGKVNYRAPHSWTQIKQNGKWWVYDPNFRNETGRSGWKIYYGKKGTWKYTNYHVFQK